MKRFFALALALMMLLTTLVISASAETVYAESYVINPELQKVIDQKSPDEMVQVGVYFEDEELRAGKVADYPIARNIEFFEAIKEIVPETELIDANGLFYVAVNVPAYGVAKIAEMENVETVEPYFETTVITETLKEYLEKADPEEWVAVAVWVIYDTSFEDYAPDFKSKEEYLQYLTEHGSEFFTAKNAEIAKEIIDGENVKEVFISGIAPLMLLSVKAGYVETLAELDSVGEIDLYSATSSDGDVSGTGEVTCPHEGIFFDKFLEKNGYVWTDVNEYKEVFVHTPEGEEDPDWAIVYTDDAVHLSEMVIVSTVIKDKKITASFPCHPFTYLYGIYDAEKDAFFGVDEIDFDDYDGLYDAFFSIDFDEEVLKLNVSDRPLGDANSDGDTTVADATRIQRYSAKLVGEDEIDLAFGDVTGDGEVTVLDATRIQRAVAKLCNIDGSDYSAD